MSSCANDGKPAALYLALAVAFACALLPAFVGAEPPLRALAQRPEVPVCDGNLLVNSGFEEGFLPAPRVGSVLPIGWHEWYARLPGVGGLNYPPEYRGLRIRRDDADSRAVRVAAGLWSVEWATVDATHIGGLMQTVAMPPGRRMQATAFARGRAGGVDRDAPSEPPGLYAVSIGLDPLGGDDHEAASIQWTAPITITDIWLPLSVEVLSSAGAVTLYLRGQAARILPASLSRWDAVCLRELGPDGLPLVAGLVAAAPPTVMEGQDTELAGATPDAVQTEAAQQELLRGAADSATERAAIEAQSDDTMATRVAVATRIASGAPVPGSRRAGVEPDPQEPPPHPAAIEQWIALAIEHSGMMAFALAALVGGWLFGLSRAENGS